MLILLDVQDLRALLLQNGSDTLKEQDAIINQHLRTVKRLIPKETVPEGVRRLLNTFPPFEAQIRCDEETGCVGDARCRTWQVSFKDSTFRDLSIASDSDGSITVLTSDGPLKSFPVLSQSPGWQALIKWLWEYGYERQTAQKIPQLNPALLTALVHDSDDTNFSSIEQIKVHLKKDGSLYLGIRLLFESYPWFEPVLHQHDVPEDLGETTGDSWHIQLQGSLFSDLCIYSTSTEGAIEIRALNNPMVSFKVLDQPRNWRSMLEWVWDYGNKGHGVQSLPQIQPRKASALVVGNNCAHKDSPLRRSDHVDIDYEHNDDVRDNLYFYVQLCVARRAFAEDRIGEGLYKLLIGFHPLCPRLHWDESSVYLPDGGYETWYISFMYSVFEDIRIQPGRPEGVVDIFAFEKLSMSFRVCDGPQEWLALLQWLWTCGNERKIAKRKRKASRLSQKPRVQLLNNRANSRKPLLHQVLRSAGLKAQQDRTSMKGQVQPISEGNADIMGSSVTEPVSLNRKPLHPGDANRRVESMAKGKEEQGD